MVAFTGQKALARKRGIAFHFTFEEWTKWWEDELGPHWVKKRGCHKGQYQMARNRDRGPYAAWNVQCKTVSQNRAETAANGTSNQGERNPFSKLTEKDIIAIFNSHEKCALLAARYGVNAKYISSIRARRSWKHITQKLPGVIYHRRDSSYYTLFKK
jgi:hypothetical protein